MLDEILKNVDWTKIILAIITLFVGIKIFINFVSNKQSQKSGNNSTNIQANGDINIGGNINDK